MELNEFVSLFADQFEETDSSEISASTEFKELEEWSSLQAMFVITAVKKKLGKTINGKEINECATVEDLFNLIQSK